MLTVKALLRDNAGMALVEVVVAAGVILVGLVALIGAVPLGARLIGESNRTTAATFLAQQRLEQIKNARWTATPAVDTLGGGGSSGTAAVAPWADEAYGYNTTYPQFRRQVRIQDCSVVICSAIPIATASANTLRQVTVTVFFRPLPGVATLPSNEEGVQIVTLIARR